MKKIFLFLSFIICYSGFVFSQTYSIVIKEGHVIDPKNNIDGVIDIAINDGKIVLVEKNIDVKQAKQVVMLRPALLIFIHTISQALILSKDI